MGTAGQPVNFGTMAHDHEMYMMLADAAAEMQDAEALEKYAPRLVEAAGRDGHQLYLGIAYRALGVGRRLAGKAVEAETLLRQGLAIFKELGTRWQLGRTLSELAEVELSRPRRRKAQVREYLAEALELFEEMQAVPHAERARERLAALG
jgi:hypothetical protein